MEKYKKGDINLLLLFLVSVIFIFGVTLLWSKNWLIDENADGSNVLLSRSALASKVDKYRNERKEKVYKSFEIYDEKMKEEKLRYINEKYGFIIHFPEEWLNYIIIEEEEKTEELKTFDSYCFGFDGTKNIFCIYAYKKNDWIKFSEDTKEKSKIFQESNFNVFTYAIKNNEKNSFSASRAREVPEIISTFKLARY